ncbi:DUF4465 domain-containing protein [Algibacter lectus]|uniref:DUF4270 domain-containing protein n=1 Tax=Algibacter lectus TaxID=221126 RepID=A0A090WC17_9FLAO|nr:DUF4465 domain-containing protein [Algibacter lectus]GAL65087.1 hypothetical protein JCM19300_2847 [Algibacter lectus]
MKFIQKYISITAAVIGLTMLSSCADQYLAELPYPEDITFNEVSLDRFSYEIPDAPYEIGDNSSGIITVNVAKSGDGSYSGFALSNRNFRSYPWELTRDFGPVGGATPAQTQEAINSTAFSVFTNDINRTENYLVGNTNNDNAYFTLSKPGIVEHVLVANTTYTALLAKYGSIYSDDLDSETQMYKLDGDVKANPNIPSTDRETVYTLPGIDGTLNTVRLAGHQILSKRLAGEAAGEATGNRAAGEAAGDAAGIVAGDAARATYIIDFPASTTEEQQAAYDTAYDAAYDAAFALAFGDAYDAAYDLAYDAVTIGDITLTIEGFLNGSSTGTMDVYLSLLEGVDTENPDYVFTLDDWKRVDLTSLGQVDKVLFKMSSSYVDNQGTMVYPPTFC